MNILRNRRRQVSNFFLIVFLSVSLSLNVLSQQKTEFLSLQNAIEAATIGNNAVQSAKIDEIIASEKLKQTNAGFLPQVNFSYSALFTNNPSNAFGFNLQQRNVKQEDFNPDLLNHPSGTSDFTTKIEVQQPLVNLDAVYMKRSAAVQVENYQLKTERTRDYLAFETRKAYYQLQLAHQAVMVLEEALTTVKSFYEFTTNRFDEGLVQKSDLLNVEVQVLDMESQLHEAKSNVQNASDYLSVLMNQSTGTIYTVSEISESSTDGEMILVVPDSRTDFKALQKAMDAMQLMQHSLKMKYLPRLNAFGSYQLNDKKLAAFNADSYLAGIQLTWNLFDGNNIKRQINTLQSEKDKLNVQLKSMQQENQMLLEKSYRDLFNALFKIKQQKAAVSQADESLRILQNRYEEGLVNTTDILNAQTQLSKQKLQLAQAIFSSNTTRAQILFLTTTSSQSK